MIYIAICDDNIKDLKRLEQKTRICLTHLHVAAVILIYNKSKFLQYDIEEGRYFDIILTDVVMPYINGIDLAAFILSHLPDAIVMFITAYDHYAISSFELSIFRYIPKSSLDSKLLPALSSAVRIITLRLNQYYIIDTPRKLEKIPYRTILYIQRNEKNSVISLIDNTQIKLRKSLSQIFKELNSEDFMYIERGTIINLMHVVKLYNDTIKLSNNSYLSVSHTKLKYIRQQLIKFWGSDISDIK